MASELRMISEAKTAQIPALFIYSLVEQLQIQADATLETPLSVLLTNFLGLSAENAEKQHAEKQLAEDVERTGNITIGNRGEYRDETFWANLKESRKKENDVEFAVQRTDDDEINEIQYNYARKIAPHKFYLPVAEWDRASLAFYCKVSNYDPKIEELLPFFWSRNTHDSTLFDADDLLQIIDDFQKGFDDVETISTILYWRQRELENAGGNSTAI